MTETKKAKSTYSTEESTKLLSIWDEFVRENPKWFEGTREAADEKISELAELLGKSVKSIVQKLSRHERYRARDYNTKTGKPVEPKDSKAEAIGKVLNLSEPETTSLTKANKTVLDKILDALAASVPLEILTPEQEAQRAEIVKRISDKLELDTKESSSLMRLNKDLLAKIQANIV